MVSTLFSLIISTTTVDPSVDPIPDLAEEITSVSEKFLRPLVWTKEFTGVINSSYWIGLLIVYERFW